MTGADAAWRDPSEVVTGWPSEVDPGLLRRRVRGPFWDLLDELGITLLVSREYEHLVLALSGAGGRGAITHLAVPHPSGIVFDPTHGVVHLASTRNPNQVLELAPVEGPGAAGAAAGTLVPVRARTLPGRLYLHDLAVVGGHLRANAVGENSVGRIGADGYGREWWPACLDDREDAFTANHLQLNSVAAGRTLATSFFTASTATPGRLKPGDRDFPVNGRGVVFSGRTREPLARGLTRPHSARLDEHRLLFVANSGYGELVEVNTRRGDQVRVARLPGWTRGLTVRSGIAFVGTSRVLPRFRQYAPGLEPDACVCGIHAVNLHAGRVIASIVWPEGDQLFAVEALPRGFADGLPAGAGRGAAAQRALFYDFQVKGHTT